MNEHNEKLKQEIAELEKTKNAMVNLDKERAENLVLKKKKEMLENELYPKKKTLWQKFYDFMERMYN